MSNVVSKLGNLDRGGRQDLEARLVLSIPEALRETLKPLHLCSSQAALLAALDPEDQRIVDVMTGAKDGGRPDHDYDDDVRNMLRALRNFISQVASVE